jgi:hypothetical protein
LVLEEQIEEQIFSREATFQVRILMNQTLKVIQTLRVSDSKDVSNSEGHDMDKPKDKGAEALKIMHNSFEGNRRSMDVIFCEGTKKDNLEPCTTTTPLPSTFPCALYEATVVYLLTKNG